MVRKHAGVGIGLVADFDVARRRKEHGVVPVALPKVVAKPPVVVRAIVGEINCTCTGLTC